MPDDKTNLSAPLIQPPPAAGNLAEWGSEAIQSLLTHVYIGIAYCRMLFENGQGVDFVYLATNPAFEAQTGLKHVVGKRANEVIPGHLATDSAFLEVLARVALGGGPERFETYVEALQKKFAIFVFSPQHECFVAIFDVISERNRAEERTRQAATVFNNTRDGVMITALDARILAVNKAFTEITEYPENEVLGQNPSFQRSDRHSPAFYKALWESLLQTGQWQGEIWNRRKSGEPYPAWTTITAVCNENGQPAHYVSVFTDQSRIKRSEEQLAYLAQYDALTDLPNRTLFQFRLNHAIERAQRNAQRVALLFIDLDHFKKVNDSFGHIVGDRLLSDVVQRLRKRVRAEDTLGRFGGDEFLLALESIASTESAGGVAQEILEAMALPYTLPDNTDIYLHASIGISLFPEDGTTAADLLREADTAMFRAKEQGRNCFRFYTADMNVSAIAQLALETALRHAVNQGEFVLYYQPKLDLRAGHITGAEALIRWPGEGIALRMPNQFIPLAEKSGLIVPIGAWVIDSACRQLRQWQDTGYRDLRLAVNVSARQFQSDTLVATVAQALERYAVPPACLELELTESMLMVDPEQSINSLTELKALGVKLSLDDFGTGYSSFAYLSRFPIDSLKIDQSFVKNIVTDPQSAMIAVSIIELAHRLHLRVVAEGVETLSQVGYLKMNRCDEMQGYYFSQPIPIEEFDVLMSSGRGLPVSVEESAGRTLLLVDDEPSILAALCRLLRPTGYRILTAATGAKGLELLATNSVQVIVADQRMPEMTGIEFLRRVKDLHPDTIRIVLSGYSDLDSVIKAVNEGAIYRFLQKPWEDDRLREHIRDAFLFHEHVVKPRGGITD